VSIRVRVPKEGVRTGFVYSPLLEAVLSLSVLAQPNHHPLHHEWVREARRRLPSEIKQRVADFGFLHMQFIPTGLIPQSDHPFPSFEEELERIRALPIERQSLPILGNVLGMGEDELTGMEMPERREALLDRASELGSATVALVELGINDPEALIENFLGGIARYWELTFHSEWERIEPQLAQTVTDGEAVLESGGLFGLLEELRPRVGLQREEGEFWIRRAHEEVLELDEGAEVLFVPSAHLWPHTGVVNDPPSRLSILYPAPFAAFDSPPEVTDDGMAPLLRALGDTTRLRALKLIAERPRSTQELAQLIAISEPAMSKHLRQLADAGVLESQRDGRYQLYSLDRRRIEPLSAMLLEFLESG
jgi:DNA-binding transcriptional ArsR family regulator